MKTTRREWLKRASAATAAMAVLPACDDGGITPLVCDAPDAVLPTDLPTYAATGPTGPESLFSHGVASGDPLPDAVILWTRLSPEASGDIEVFYEVALDTAFTRRIAAGTFVTSEARDFTVKVDATGLLPGRTFYYRFMAQSRTSPIGRTRTAPVGSTAHLRLAVVSCSNFAAGWFHAYRRIAERADLDAVIHLGDYIYEYASGAYGKDRPNVPAYEIITLADYRARYACYRADPDLQAVHQQHPMIAVWDDHETANDAWREGAQNHDPATEGPYADRRAAAGRAYAEWMPIREQASGVIYRTVRFGDLLDLVMLDTRIVGRDQPLESIGGETEARTLLGATQEAWLANELTTSTAHWRMLGQQVMMGQLAVSQGAFLLNLDQWDGYPHARGRLLDVIEQNGIDNVVVLTGDIHSSWANEIVRDPWRAYDPLTSEGALAVEFVTPSVTSQGLGESDDDVIGDIAKMENPHVKFLNTWAHGYLLLDVQRGQVQCDFMLLDGILQDQGVEAFKTGFLVRSGKPRLEQTEVPTIEREGCDFAPGS